MISHIPHSRFAIDFHLYTPGNRDKISDEIHYLTGFSLKDFISWGNTGMVCLDEPSQTVVKSPHREENDEVIAIEKRIYERLSGDGGHPGLLCYYGPYEFSIRLKLAYDDLRSFLQIPNWNIDIEQRLWWAREVAEVLRCPFEECRPLICGNMLLDVHLNAKLAEFAGSSLDGCPLLVAVTASHQCPGPALSILGDIFALGSIIYEITIGEIPCHECSNKEIKARYLKGDFSDTKSLRSIGDSIRDLANKRL